ncbi:MAG: (2Fe-2S) ferredoxin [Planctomycetota bacterium]|jgi:(2Fe-2S) ferredoxin
MPTFQRHVFVCTRDRGEGHPRGCCASKDSAAVLDALKSGVAARGLRRVVRAQGSGCLDQCARGVTLVVYPDAVWYGAVNAADVDEILDEHVLGGRVVERLRIPEDQLTGVVPPADEPGKCPAPLQPPSQ